MTAQPLLGPRRLTNWLLVYGSLIVLTEGVLVFVSVALGAALMAGILVAIISQHALAPPPRDPILPVLALVPVTVLLSVAIPVVSLSAPVTYALVGGPVLLGSILVARAIGLSLVTVGMGTPKRLVEVALVIATGIPLGLLARFLGGLEPLSMPGLTVELGMVVILVFIVLPEELLFRGLLRHLASIRFGVLGIVAPNIIYSSLYFGSGSATVVIFMLAVGLYFSLAASRSGSLWGVIGAHLLLRLVIEV